MGRLVIYTYFFLQFLSVSFGLIQLELALKGAAEMQVDLWLLQVLKPILLMVIALAFEPKKSLALKLYLPQIFVDIAYLTSTSNQTSWLAIGAGYAFLCLSIVDWSELLRPISRFVSQPPHAKPILPVRRQLRVVSNSSQYSTTQIAGEKGCI